MLRLFLLVIFFFSSCGAASAQEIVLVYTGSTHAMVYPCNCPIESDGGIARRATLINQLRKDDPRLLFLDSGNFFSSGLLDHHTQNSQLDKERALVNLQAMELMRYDAVNISDDEFNFGEDFFQESAAEFKVNLTCANIRSGRVLPFIIKEVSGIKIGIIGLANSRAKNKVSKITVTGPNEALKEAVASLKEKGVDIIILLSNLGHEMDESLTKEIAGVDLVIDGLDASKKPLHYKVGNTIFLKPSWQGRRLGKATLDIKDKKIVGYKAEEIRVSGKIKDDPAVSAILPRCFSDNDCRKEGLVGTCMGAGRLNAKCIFSESSKVKLTLVNSRDCPSCNTEQMVNLLKKIFPGLEVSQLYYPQKDALNLVKKFNLSGLPAYLLGKEAGGEQGFGDLKDSLEDKGDFYILKSEAAGVGYLLNRNNTKGSLDVFISLFDKDAAGILGVVRDFDPNVHFLAVPLGDTFDAPKGAIEVEEDLRAVCVKKHYPQAFFDYISCRAKNINSSWWEDCLPGEGIQKIRECAKSEEGSALLKDNISLNKELKIMFGPTYLLDNQEIFSSRGVIKKEEFRKIIKR